MPRQIREIRVPRNVISELPRPVVEASIPVVRGAKPPVVRGISPPVVDVPDTTIEYPTIDIKTEQEFQGDMSPQQEPQTSTPVSYTHLTLPTILRV